MGISWDKCSLRWCFVQKSLALCLLQSSTIALRPREWFFTKHRDRFLCWCSSLLLCPRVHQKSTGSHWIRQTGGFWVSKPTVSCGNPPQGFPSYALGFIYSSINLWWRFAGNRSNLRTHRRSRGSVSASLTHSRGLTGQEQAQSFLGLLGSTLASQCALHRARGHILNNFPVFQKMTPDLSLCFVPMSVEMEKSHFPMCSGRCTPTLCQYPWPH